MSDQLKLEDEEIPILLRRAWDRTLRSLATRVNKPTFETHIRTLRPVTLAEENEAGKPVYVVTLGVPSAFTREWVEKRHAPLIAGILEEILDRDVRLRFVLSPKAAAAPAMGSLFAETAAPPAAPAAPDTRLHGPSLTAEAPEGGSGDDDAFTLTPETAPAPKATRRSSSGSAAPETPALSVPALAADVTPRPPAPALSPSSARRSPEKGSGGTADAPHLNSRYTFDNFVTGPSNRLAQAGARAVAQAPGQVYNPLFLYGPSGLGKTHLMHAIGNEYIERGGGSGSRIAYISGEAFTSHYITSLREHRAEEFRRKWRSVDLWLVDDIQFIAGKEHTKEEFFHTFNALYQTGKQIVISSDRSPRDLRMMDERLRSRFECGLIADIAPPDLETRLAILHKKADTERMRIPDEVLLYMARLVQSNIRTLEGALVKLIAYASLANSPVTTQLASSVLERYYIAAGIGNNSGNNGANGGHDREKEGSAAGNGETTAGSGENGGFFSLSGGVGAASSEALAEAVQRVVARRFGITPGALIGKKRDRDVVNARQIAMHLMRELTEMSLPGIGQLFGRDHSTVAHSCDKVRSQLPFDDDLRTLVEDLTTQIRSQQQAAG